MGQAAEREEPAQAVPEFLPGLAQALPLGIALVAEGRVRWANPALRRARAAATQAAELIGIRFADLFADAGQGLPDRARTRPVECALRRPNGAERRVICQLAWPRSRSRAATLWSVEDVTQLRAARARAAARQPGAPPREPRARLAARGAARGARRARGAARGGEPRAAHAADGDRRLQPAAAGGRCWARHRRAAPLPDGELRRAASA